MMQAQRQTADVAGASLEDYQELPPLGRSHRRSLTVCET